MIIHVLRNREFSFTVRLKSSTTFPEVSTAAKRRSMSVSPLLMHFDSAKCFDKSGVEKRRKVRIINGDVFGVGI